MKDKAKMESISKPDGQVVDLNIGGTHQMTCSIDVLISDKGSDLEKLFSGNFKHKIIDGKVFLDRDGEVFKQVINYLRNGRKQIPVFSDKYDENMFHKELKFWKIGAQNRRDENA